jgi:hypothetical protein
MSKPVIELSLTRAARNTASVNLGRTAIYGSSSEKLQHDISIVGEAIDRCSRGHLTLAKVVLAKLVRDDLKLSTLNRRLFGALLGRQLRLGHLDAVLCESTGGKTFWAIVNGQRLADFQNAAMTAENLLKTQRVLSIKEVESTLFSTRSYGTWSSAAHVCAHLVYFGRAQYDDDNILSRPEGLDYAVRASE